MGKPMENTGDAVTEAVMVVGLVTERGQENEYAKGKKGSGKPPLETQTKG